MRRLENLAGPQSRGSLSQISNFTPRRSKMRVLLRLAVLIAFFSWVCSAGAQITSNGDITGTVKDPSGAALPGATVTITNADTGLVARRVTSDQSGNYSAPLLSVGRYNIDVESSGFKKVTLKNVELNAH